MPELAPRWKRLAAWVLDACFAGLLVIPARPLISGPPLDPANLILVLIVLELVLFALLIYFDGSPRGQTPGKMLVRTRVVDEDGGGPIGYRRAAIRRLAYIGGYLCLLLGWLWLLWDPRRQAWHDKAAHSLVVSSQHSAA